MARLGKAVFGRRGRPPAEAVGVLAQGEHVVSWADTANEDVVLATPRGLWWPDPTGRRRIAWEHVDKVVWQDNILSVIEAEIVDDALLVDRPAVYAKLTVPRDLPPVIRKRVQQNIVKNELLAIAGGGVRFVARRLPGRDGLAWWARLEPGTPDTATVRSAIAARLEILRQE